MCKYDNRMMQTAKVWAEESFCERKKVGAIIARDGRIVSNGYNGTVSGSENRCEDTNYTCDSCEKSSPHAEVMMKSILDNSCNFCDGKVSIDLKSKNTVVHAEANAILFAAREGIPTKDCTIYITLSPCVECAKMIIQSGINNVVYSESYKGDIGASYLKDNGISVTQLKA